MDDIDSLPPIERMVDLNEARVFRIRGVVNHVLADFRNPVPVLNTACQTIGYAALSLENDEIVAEAVICYSTPERLYLQVDDRCYLSAGCKEAETHIVRLYLSRTGCPEWSPVEVIP